MNLYESMIANARPRSIRPDEIFTENVMSTIQTDQSRKRGIGQFSQLLHRNPIIAVFLMLLGVTVVASATYAAVQLWPKAQSHLTHVEQKDGHAVLTVFSENCDAPTQKRYGVKTGATITADQAPLIVAAECNLRAIDTWTREAYPDVANAQGAIGAQLPNKPGNVVNDVLMPSSPVLATIVAVSSQSISVQAGGYVQTYPVTKDTTIIAHRTIADSSKLKVGDAVATFVSTRESLAADPDCTEQNCHYSFVEGKRKQTLRMVATLDQPLELYQSGMRQQLYEIEACMGNAQDDCTMDGTGIELYTSGVTEDAAVPQGRMQSTALPEGATPAWIQGKLVAWNSKSLTIKTSSGRLMTIGAPLNLIDTYNTNRAGGFRYTIGAGDTISIRYTQLKDSNGQLSLDQSVVNSVDLKVSTLGKGDRTFKRF